MKEKVQRLMEAQQVKAVMAQLDRDEKRMVDDQIELCAINSPSNQEEKRAKRYEEMFRELPFDKVWMDEVWNVYGLLKGTGDGPKIVISAHMDTVFDADTDVTPRIDENGVIHAPGITDDTRGMAEVLGIARAMMETGVRAMGDILFCGTVGEEVLGNLRGTRHLFKTMDDIDGFISIDGPMPEKITLHAIASMVYHVTYRGVGGHALGMFGIPNANNAMGRAIAKISDLQVPKKPVTVFNVGIARGGTSTNGIPTKSELMIDMRSMQDAELDRLADRIAACCREASRGGERQMEPSDGDRDSGNRGLRKTAGRRAGHGRAPHPGGPCGIQGLRHGAGDPGGREYRFQHSDQQRNPVLYHRKRRKNGAQPHSKRIL